MLKTYFSLLFIVFISYSSFAQTSNQQQLTRILFIFDASNSMNGKWERGKSKFDIAREILINLVDSLEAQPNLEFALRIYGHQSPYPPQDCSDTKLEVAFAPKAAPLIRQKLMTVIAQGTTPIAYSLQLCADDFPNEQGVRNVIILITDGIEACKGDPCAMALALQKKGITLRPFVIGLGLDIETIEAFKCLGTLFNADNEQKLQEILKTVTTQAVGATTLQVNLLDIYNKPTETNVNMTFYDQQTGYIRYNYIHTINEYNVPDTLIIDPLPEYRIVVHTLPPVEIQDIKLISGKHNVVQKPTPQGFLTVKEARGNLNKDVKIIVRETDDYMTLNIQQMDENGRYLVGQYDLEILTLPRLYKYNIQISQSKISTIEIPEPGVVTFVMKETGFGSLHVKEASGYKWVCNLDGIKKKSFNLLPGKYLAVYRKESAKKTIYTDRKIFEVKSGYTQAVEF